jgi:hypothetical protein
VATELAAPAPSGAGAAGQAVPVLFIAGFGRSGSTLLDRLLGSTPDVHSGGELAAIWTHGLVADRLCSCGAPFSGCPFWCAVGRDSFSALRAPEIGAVVRYFDGLLPVWKIWRLLSRRTRRGLVNSAPAGFFGMLERIYQGVRAASARQVVVDSSKLAAYLLLLAQAPAVDVRVVHLVRDPRAVTHSWLRPLVADPDGRSSMPRFGVVKSAALWLIMNVAVEWVARRLRLPYLRVRYEDLVRDPAHIVRELRSELLAERAERDAGAVGPREGEYADLGVVHSISGNPMRFRQGRIPIVEDAGWKAGSRSRAAIVAAITFPLRWRYGYGGRR